MLIVTNFDGREIGRYAGPAWLAFAVIADMVETWHRCLDPDALDWQDYEGRRLILIAGVPVATVSETE